MTSWFSVVRERTLAACVVCVCVTACLDATPAPTQTFPMSSAGAPGAGGSAAAGGGAAGATALAGAATGGNGGDALGGAGSGGIGVGGSVEVAGGAGVAGGVAGGGSLAGAGGAGGAAAGYACVGTVTASAGTFITQFTGATATSWSGDVAGLTGGYFAYPAPLTATIVDDSLHIAPMVTGYAGFAISFDTCTDASAAGGISFSIKGNAGASGKLLLAVLTNEDQAVDVVQMKRGCVPAESDPSLAYKYCASPSKTIMVTQAGSVVTAMWADFMNGKPKPTIDPTQIVGVQWTFDWSSTATAYPVDLTIDDVKLVPKAN